jgi:branched-chain amino acid transport system permease protein
MFLQALIDGILLGGVYSTIAVGQSLTFGIMRVINWAHGECLMIAMYISYYLVTFLNMDPYLTMVITSGVMFLYGYFLQKYPINLMMTREETKGTGTTLLFTAGLGMVMTNLALIFLGPTPRFAETVYSGASIKLGEIIVSVPKVISFSIAITCTIILYIFLQFSSTGRSLRATSQNRTVARLMGIDVERIFCIAFGIGLGIVGIAAALLTPFYAVYPTVGLTFSFRSFIIVVLGGRGSIPGTMIAGIIVGLIEKIGGLYIYESYAQALTFVLFIIMLLFRPRGLMGTQED